MMRRSKPAVAVLIFSSFALLSGCAGEIPPSADWPDYQGDPGRNQYSGLRQIHRGNVGRLEAAWVYRTGDADPENRSQIQCNPLVVDGVLYGTSARIRAFAIDASTGRERWTFDPWGGEGRSAALGVNRGVAYWASGNDRRVLLTAGHFLYALDADTGRPIPEFGNRGGVDIREGLGRDPASLFVIATTPGAVYNDLLILGSRVGEGPGPAPPGHIRAYDVRTGRIVWTFRTIPHPGEFGHETWPEGAWEWAGGANCWAGMSVDEVRGVVYVPTGSAAFDFWGGNRKGANLFANSVLALQADTGRRIWHFQVVRHDLWDRDLPAPPNLVTLRREGRRVDAVAQVTKSGHVFLFDRDSGGPLFPIEERPYPESDLKEEETWPTQPLPLLPPPFARQAFRPEDATDLSPESRAFVLERLSRVRRGGQFVPPSTEGTMIFPGFDGGAEWGGAAFDPDTGILYVNSNEMPWILTMVDLEERRREALSMGEEVYAVHCGVCHGPELQGDPQGVFPPLVALHERFTASNLRELVDRGKGFMPGFEHLPGVERDSLVSFLLGESGGAAASSEEVLPGILYSHTGYNRFLDPDGYPAVKPPWGTLNAIDLNRGELLWQVPLGEVAELTARGIPPTGTENYGGPVVTAGGLIFIGATKDEKFRAFDKETGEVLWEADLPAGGYATPATYSVDGRQYVVIAAGGGKMGTKSGDAYVAFALPR
jgi:quinoprotein glucose dehydrogenase